MRYFWAFLMSVGVLVVGASSCSSGNKTGTGATGGSNTGGAGSGGTTTGSGGQTGIMLGGDAGLGTGDGGSCAAYQDCAAQNLTCGMAGDGCGNILDCGTCASGESCTAGACVQSCTPATCASAGFDCGVGSDGCGGLTANCGSCASGQVCGANGMPNVCGVGSCVPTTCAALNYTCGSWSDGCTTTLNCGSCGSGQACNGGTCKTVCTAQTCGQIGATCGAQSDGCGGILQCGTCSGSQSCVGKTCGTGANCTGYCLNQVTCPGTATTSVSGTVYAPNGRDPLPNTLVYVPNGTVAAFTQGVSCGSCGSDVSGDPLVSAITDYQGKFTIPNMPATTSVPLVIQNGRWRRQFVIPSVPQCVNTALPSGSMPALSMPTTKAQGDIPLMAFVTGAVDGLECVLRKIGVADSEFTDPTGTGRIRFYLGDDGNAGAQISKTTPGEKQLWGTQATINQYDMVYFPCKGVDDARTSAAQGVVTAYANAGGRVFATHYSYDWLYNTSPFSTTATWKVDPNDNNTFTNDPATGYIITTFPRGLLLAEWLNDLYTLGLLPAPAPPQGQIQINTLRHDFTAVAATSQLWIYENDPGLGNNVPMHYTFDTPVGSPPASQCGRVLYDDFHVEDLEINPSKGQTFPAECACQPDTSGYCTVNAQCCSNNCDMDVNSFTYQTCLGPKNSCKEPTKACTSNSQCCSALCAGGVCVAPMTPQEKMLEFMIFDLGSCVTPPTCTPTTCAAQGVTCGEIGDGCGSTVLQCGTCPSGQSCIGGKCAGNGCTPESCQDQGYTCGTQGDGCGNTIMCGSCPSGQTCGGGGTGKCGNGSCTPMTTCPTGMCGTMGDGCGNTITCNPCPSGESCAAGKCSMTGCVAKTCAQLGYTCGAASDGCGNIIQCGTCAGNQTCGGGGSANVCGGGV